MGRGNPPCVLFLLEDQMANVIIPGKVTIGKTRSEQVENIKKEWGGHGGLSEESHDKCKFLEKRVKNKYGSGAERFLRDADIKKVRSSHKHW